MEKNFVPLEQQYFKSEIFDIELGEDEETNPRIYGKQLSAWLRTKFIELGYEVKSVIPEDWGWCVMCKRAPFSLWIGCGSVINYEHGDPEGPIPDTNDVVWYCFVVAEIPFLKRIFNKPDVEPEVSKLRKQLYQLLSGTKRIHLLGQEEANA
ncbi:hypothetical protein P3339_17285 [Microbulbifer sp. MLAF003]|uniref:hypothetical protein n=1 Tax=Microbulbifer sp. MLAF003 TaxID=3032582 RepID=UPI0024AE1A01|nr:hypothetical protein [Microbulbifer sp. MLAF003]WHI50185.1 hypothetical protein P3339_17285 [Microbulbifer sp. MLAF003]